MTYEERTGLGLTKGKVRVEPANEGWSTEAKWLIEQLDEALGANAVAIEHVGSTAVSGLEAKPILDIAVGLNTNTNAPDLIPGLVEQMGLIYRGDKGHGGGHLFVLEDRPLHRVAHIHLVPHDSEQWRDYLAFRDRLRADPDTRRAYADLKLRLAREFPDDRASYTAGKQAFISRLLDMNARSREDHPVG